MPNVPFANDVGFTVIAGHTGVIVKVAEPVQEFASVAVMVKVRVAVLVGVPVTAPVVVLRLKPTGSVPLVTAYT